MAKQDARECQRCGYDEANHRREAHPYDPRPTEQAAREALRERLAEGHEWRGYACECGLEVNSPRGYREHLLDVLLPAVEEYAAEAVREFAEWVATSRAYNGSDYEHGQSLYNECLNAVLPTWAAEYAQERKESR